jgi:hypothetical protein
MKQTKEEYMPTVVTQVFSTKDYGKFKTIGGNRNINKLHVKRLRESFQDNYLLSPIIVNGSHEIIDGQHRFEAAKSLNLPIYYIICLFYSLKEVQVLNTNMKNWGMEDYLNAFCDLKYPEYLKFKEFMTMFPDFNISSCLAIAGCSLFKNTKSKLVKNESNKSGSYQIRYFQNGDLVIPDYYTAVENAEKIMMIKPLYDGYNKTVFVRAMVSMFKIKYYSHDQFINRLSANAGMMQHCARVTQYKLLIEEIYNFRSREKVTLRF